MRAALETLADGQAVAAAAADLVGEALARNPEATLLLPAGRTPVPLYAELARRVRAGELDLARAQLFQLDEMVDVPARDPRSFQAFLREHLIARVPRLPGRDHLLCGDAADPRAEIESHAAALAASGGAELALLGLGRNGHVAFNEPGSTPESRARVVDLCPRTRASLEGFGDQAPRRGMTLGLAEIAAASQVVLLVTGPSKRETLARLLNREPGPDLPASWLRDHPGLVILADAEAAPGAPA